MSTSQNLMEIRESQIRAHYDAAFGLLNGFDHTPRIAKPRADAVPATSARSPGIPGRRQFRSTTPGLATRSTARPEGVSLIARIDAADHGDPLTSPIQSTVLQALRRALATANAVTDLYAEQTALAALKRDNLEGRLADGRRAEFSELLAAASLIALHVFANMTAFLLVAHTGEAGEGDAETGDLAEVLNENPQLALHGVLWELGRELLQKVAKAPLQNPFKGQRECEYDCQPGR